MNVRKMFWMIRSIVLKPFFKKYGSLSYMGKPLFLSGIKNIQIGRRVRIYPGLRLEAQKGGRITIGDNCSIGQNFSCTSSGKVEIGRDTTISGNVLITSDDHEYKNIGQHIMDQPLLMRDTIIGENSFIGYGAVILGGVKLGKQCIVGANSVVKSGEYPDYSVIAGVTGKIIKKYSNGFWENIKEE